MFQHMQERVSIYYAVQLLLLAAVAQGRVPSQ